MDNKKENTQKKAKNIDIQNNIKNAINTIFNSNTLPYFAGFIALYTSLYFGIHYYYRGYRNIDIIFSKAIDIFIITLLVIAVGYYLVNLPQEDKDHFIGFLVKWTKEFFQYPNGTYDYIIVIILFYSFVYLGKIPKNPIPVIIEFLEQKVWIFLVTFIILDFFKYYFEIDLVEKIISKDIVNWLYGK